jgi:hypothetical protein
MAGSTDRDFMKLLLIAPALGLDDVDRTALEIQRLGYETFPLTGAVTEEQIAAQCDASRGFDVVVWLTHGTDAGLELSPALHLSVRQTAVYMQALNGSLRLVVLASCDGLNTAAQVKLACQAAVIYSDGPLLTATVMSALTTTLRSYLQQGLDRALDLAQTSGLRVLYGAPADGKRSLDTLLEQWGRLITTSIARLDERVASVESRLDTRIEGVEGQIGALEGRIDARVVGVERGLSTSIAQHPVQSPAAWLAGFVVAVIATLLAATEAHVVLGLDHQATFVIVLVLLPLAAWLLARGAGIRWRPL